ncbi:MAG: tetratricopeptide repeat protein [Bacteroidia bacterium]|nr:tetratricopeptide repeat protein [Bacteroidia bacterium]MDW8157882.1 tetratricopeptide repeat protein [Bacteroidia bacterium]
MAKSSKSNKVSTSTANQIQITNKKATPPILSQWFVHAIIIVIAAILAFGNTHDHEYAGDDQMYTYGNVYTRNGIKGIPDILTKDSFHGFWGDSPDFAKRYFRPLAIVTFAIEREISKNAPPPLDFNPYRSHKINILFFAITLLLIYRLQRKFLFPQYPYIALISTLLFAVHPIHCEVVASLKGRDELLSMLFVVLTLNLGFAYALNPKWKTAIGLGVAYLLALFSKENGIMLLFLFPLTLWIFQTQNLKKIAFAALPLLITFIFYIGWRLYFIGFNPSVPSTDVLSNFYYGKPFWVKYATIFSILLFYLQLLFFPHPLSWDYSFAQMPFRDFTDPIAIIAVLIYVGSIFWAIKTLKDHKMGSSISLDKILAFSILFFVGSLFIVSNLVINIGGYIGERFLFQASLGFCIFLATIFWYIYQNQKLGSFSTTAVIITLAVTLILALQKTISRNKDWFNGYTLVMRDVVAAPNSTKTNAAAGGQLVEKANQMPANSPEREALLNQAIPLLTRAIQIHPGYAQAAMELGTAYFLKNNLDSAQKYYLQAYKYKPNYPTLLQNLCRLYNQKAIEYYNQKNLNLAIQSAEIATNYDPKHANAWSNLGVFYSAIGQYDKAIHAFSKATEIEPQNAEYWYSLGWAYGLKEGETAQNAKAIVAYQKALQINPNHTSARAALQRLQK